MNLWPLKGCMPVEDVRSQGAVHASDPRRYGRAPLSDPTIGTWGTSLIRNSPPVGPYSSPMPRDLW